MPYRRDEGNCFDEFGFDVDLMRFERERRNAAAPRRPSGLDRPLVVSLTSYPPRFRYLHCTLVSLLQQSIVPDEIILWIARDDLAHLPDEVRALGDRIRIAPCDDVRSYKKLVFTVEEDADRFVAIADDDVYYRHDWLEELIGGLGPQASNSSCHITFRFHGNGSGLAPFLDWEIDPQDYDVRVPCANALPIGVGGVLYPPNAFNEDLARRDLFEQLAPYSDDIWFYAMARLNGIMPAKVGGRFVQILWPETQRVSLWSSLAPARSDRAIEALSRRYGASLFAPDKRAEAASPRIGSELPADGAATAPA